LIRYLLTCVQNETMPITVEGDVQFGFNKTKMGWNLWLINNKGVTKYPLESVVAPSIVPFITTFAPSMGLPSPDLTVPLIIAAAESCGNAANAVLKLFEINKSNKIATQYLIQKI
ncbi:MAG TPA: hypothetical protein PK447_06855, partial [Ignavibacteria bacterium]|nr:hypothetical protein [Ignavibacteria bacterium]